MAQAERWAYANAKNNIIATRLGWDKNLIDQRPDIKERLTLKRAEGDIDLLVKEHDKALGGDTTMLIWVGKNRLGQTDRNETKLTAEAPLVVVIGGNNANGPG